MTKVDVKHVQRDKGTYCSILYDDAARLVAGRLANTLTRLAIDCQH